MVDLFGALNERNRLSKGSGELPKMGGSGGGGSPAGVPVPLCTPPSIFTDCFTGYAGAVPTLPATNNGWGSPTGAPATGAFDGDQMVFTLPTGFDFDAQKPLASPLSSTHSLQFRFTESPDPPSSGNGYNITLFDGTGTSRTFLELVDDGSLQIGDRAAVALFSGTWTPSPGATHTVHLTCTGFAAYTLSIDGVAIPLVVDGVQAPVAGTADSVVVQSANSGTPAWSMAWDYIMVNGAVDPASTVYCCPNGNPAD